MSFCYHVKRGELIVIVLVDTPPMKIEVGTIITSVMHVRIIFAFTCENYDLTISYETMVLCVLTSC